jgi:hypothetical protein
LLFPLGFDVLDDFADCFDRGVAFGGEADAFGALVVVVGFAGEVSELLELAEQVVERLFGHARLGRELQGALVLGAGVLKHVQVRRDQVGEAALVIVVSPFSSDSVVEPTSMSATVVGTTQALVTPLLPP